MDNIYSRAIRAWNREHYTCGKCGKVFEKRLPIEYYPEEFNENGKPVEVGCYLENDKRCCLECYDIEYPDAQ